MNKANLKYALLVLLAAVLLSVSGIWHHQSLLQPENSGRLVFAQTYNHGSDLSKVIITTPQQNKITFELENNLWEVKEADYYFADMKLLNQLFITMNTSRLLYRQPYSNNLLNQAYLHNPLNRRNQYNGYAIQTYDNRGQLLDEFIVGHKTANRTFQYIKAIGQDEIWLTDGNYQLPQDPASWLIQPITDYSADMIENIGITENESRSFIQREDLPYPFINAAGDVVNPTALLERFNYLIAEKILSAQNFDERLFPNHREIILTFFNGLRVQVNLFYDSANYWLKIKLSATDLPTLPVKAYINDNKYLYEDWYFKIPSSAGEVLSQYKFN